MTDYLIEKTPALAPLMKKEIKERFPEFDDKYQVSLDDEAAQAKLTPG